MKQCRKLRRNEMVHHKDGDPTNDTLENLVIVSGKVHHYLHDQEKARKLWMPQTP